MFTVRNLKLRHDCILNRRFFVSGPLLLKWLTQEWQVRLWSINSTGRASGWQVWSLCIFSVCFLYPSLGWLLFSINPSQQLTEFRLWLDLERCSWVRGCKYRLLGAKRKRSRTHRRWPTKAWTSSQRFIRSADTTSARAGTPRQVRGGRSPAQGKSGINLFCYIQNIEFVKVGTRL